MISYNQTIDRRARPKRLVLSLAVVDATTLLLSMSAQYPPCVQAVHRHWSEAERGVGGGGGALLGTRKLTLWLGDERGELDGPVRNNSSWSCALSVTTLSLFLFTRSKHCERLAVWLESIFSLLVVALWFFLRNSYKNSLPLLHFLQFFSFWLLGFHCH